MPKRVLILCTGNTARSQLAEALLRLDGQDNFEVLSAGIEPGTVRPEAIQVLREIGLDISAHRAKSVDEFEGQHFDYVITVCDNARQECPVFSASAKQIHKSFVDPPPLGIGDEDWRLAIFRNLRDEIRQWLQEFIIADQESSRKDLKG